MDEIYENFESGQSVKLKYSANFSGPRTSKWSLYVGLNFFLILLSVSLLVGLIILGVRCHTSVHDVAAELSANKENLTKLLQTSNDKLSSMTEERDLLKANLTEKNKELERLQSLSKQKKTCPAGWKMFNCTCYFLSEASGSWDEARQDCRNRGADLVVIDSPEEQTSVSTLTKAAAWIGLNDRGGEDTWKWVDGTPLSLRYWGEDQPDNGGKDAPLTEEDCAHIRAVTSEWNDLPCQTSVQWICEKQA
ncbi:CD209 antigen-like protein C [Mugil cephalus]|uniref:CD209 antigen-like protein C n=1 Tax=Mugil cephalus TaxID=48193 RepID=UPI001FB576B7|nr:CD209 antigen-like protein C [Mugil cephalus]